MSKQLISLVQADPVLIIYALENLGKNVPTDTSNPFYSRIVLYVMQPILTAVMPLLIGKDPNHRLTPDQIARLETIWGRRADEIAKVMRTAESLQGIVKTLRDAELATVQSRLRDDNLVVRQVTLQVIAQRRLPLERDVIDLLRDPKVSTTAHEALVRLARGTDFGPFPGASRRGIDRSIEKWRQWLALQQSAWREKEAKDAAIAAGKQGKPATLEMVPLILVHDEKPALAPGVTEACDELVNAKGDEQLSVLARLRDAKGIDNTDALALAIPRLSGPVKRQARDALSERLTRMTTATLRDKLQDDNVEVRCAAALACGRKNSKEVMPDLLQLLDDPEMDVIQTARAALTELSGKDFGPKSDADRRGRAEAAAAWRKWWKERQSKNPQ
ncbi:MAG: HEAT repeat domain-containing protein [Gemmataceae bacterium]